MNILMYSPYFLFVFKIVAYSLMSYNLVRYYRKYRFLAHVLLLGGFVFSIIAATLILFASFYDELTPQIKLVNKLIVLFYFTSYAFWTLGLYLFKNPYLPSYIYLYIYFIGTGFAAFFYSNIVFVKHPVLMHWNAKLPGFMVLIILPLILLPIYSFAIPLFNKLRFMNDYILRQGIFLILLGIFMVYSWGFWVAITPIICLPLINLLEGILIPLGWLLFFIGTHNRPLLISFSTARPVEIIVVSTYHYGILFKYSFSKNKILSKNRDLVAALLGALSVASSETFNVSETARHFIIDQHHVLLYNDSKSSLSFILFSEGIDDTIVFAFKVFVNLVLSKYRDTNPYQTIDLTQEVKETFEMLLTTPFLQESNNLERYL